MLYSGAGPGGPGACADSWITGPKTMSMPTPIQDRSRRRGWRGLWRSRDGGALIEFAFAAPLLVVSVAAVIEFGMIMFMNSLMEGAIREASRFGITGYAPSGVSREQEIANMILEGAVGLVKPADITISTLVYSNFSSIGQPEPFVDGNGNGSFDPGETYNDINGNGQWDADMGASGVGGPGDVVVYTATVDWSLVTRLLDPVFGDTGKMTLKASTVVRNEPYNVPAGP
jgi:TadE-like protein